MQPGGSSIPETNIQKLAALWLEVSENKDQKQYEKMVDEALRRQNQFQESIAQLIESYENEAARLKAAAVVNAAAEVTGSIGDRQAGNSDREVAEDM